MLTDNLQFRKRSLVLLCAFRKIHSRGAYFPEDIVPTFQWTTARDALFLVQSRPRAGKAKTLVVWSGGISKR